MASKVEKKRRPIKPLKSSIKSTSLSKPSAAAPASSSKKETDDLKSVILAFGGGEEDYALVKDLDSDDMQEFSDHEANSKTTKDIANFLKKLNFKAQDAIVSESDTTSDDESEPPKKVAAAQALTAPSEEAKAVKKQLAAARLNIPASAQWYAVEFPSLRAISNLPAPTQAQLSSIRAKAEALHAALPPPPSTSKSDEQFIANVLASGTLSDRLSALTLMAQSSPIHNTRALENLRSMASKKGREESLKALRAIVDWWVGGGGPDRKLKYFADQPFNHPDITDAQLTMWYFEDWLKKYFFNVLQLLETLSQDLLPYVRTQAMTLIFQLLDGKPEQEQNLLRLLVNKLGDSEKNVASKASYQLLQILQHHPGMKAIIVREVSALVFRPPAKTASASTSSDGVNLHARYYSIITLNQMTLSANPPDQAVAGQLVDLYFKLFKEILHEGARNEKAGPATSKLAPTVEGSDPLGKGKGERRDFKGKTKSKGPPNAKGKAPEVSSSDGFTEVEDSDSKTISAILSGVNRAMPFAKPDDATFDSHIDTLFRITHTATFNVSVQALMLILQVTSSKESVSDRFYRTLYESILDQRLINSSKQAMWLNLMFKAVKVDKSFARICAFVKRTLQSLNMHQPPFICGSLYMIGQLMETTPGLRDILHVPHPIKPEIQAKELPKDSAEHSDTHYDPRKRDPQYAHAETTCLWELVPLLRHFHPSVSLHARQILTSAQVTATPDLALNTLSHFLDRFVYKNPKQPKPRGASVMQPAASAHDASGSVHLIRGGVAGLDGTVNEESFWKMKASQVPVDQLFFHKFFLNRLDKQNDKNKKIAKRRKEGEDDNSSDDVSAQEDNDKDSEGEVSTADEGELDQEQNEQSELEENSDDSDEAEIWRVMQETMPGPKADLDLMEDSESDDIPSGLDDDSIDSESEDGNESVEAAENLDAEAASISDAEEDSAEDRLNADDDSTDDEEVDFAEDEDDLVDLDDEVLIPSAFEPEDSEAVSGKRKPSKEDTEKGGRKKRKLGALPTFASYEDYAKLIEEAPEEDL